MYIHTVHVEMDTRERERGTERDRDRQTDRQTETEREVKNSIFEVGVENGGVWGVGVGVCFRLAKIGR